jgi:hypothetical protein
MRWVNKTKLMSDLAALLSAPELDYPTIANLLRLDIPGPCVTRVEIDDAILNASTAIKAKLDDKKDEKTDAFPRLKKLV